MQDIRLWEKYLQEGLKEDLIPLVVYLKVKTLLSSITNEQAEGIAKYVRKQDLDKLYDFARHKLACRSELKQEIRRTWPLSVPSMATLLSFCNDLFTVNQTRNAIKWLAKSGTRYLRHLLQERKEEEQKRLRTNPSPCLPPFQPPKSPF